MIGKILRGLRQSRNITQADMADTLEIDRSTYTKYESGKSKPDSNMLEKLADFFQVSVDYLLGRTIPKNSEELKADTRIYSNLDVSGLSDEDIRKVEEYVELLKNKYNPDGSLK